MNTKHKKIIAFDMDGTLTESKVDLDSEMAGLVRKLLQKKLVAVMGGASFTQFQKQFINKLNAPHNELKNLLIFPTSSASYYRHNGKGWEKIYENLLTVEEQEEITAAFGLALKEINYIAPCKIYVDVIQNLGAQITFSALGQSAPLSEKQEWHDSTDRRVEIKDALDRIIPGFEVRIGGLTSMNITKKGIDKSYGIEQIEKLLKIPKQDMIFAGDALYEGGNDYPVKRAGVETLQVDGPQETKRFIKSILS